MLARDLDGKVAIITGGGGAIGGATAERLARAGAKIAVADIRESGAAKVADRLRSEGLTVEPFKVDLASEAEIRSLIEAVVEQFGRLDIVHNNAAALTSVFEADQMLVDLPVEVWDAAFAVNVRAPMLMSKYAIPHMLRQGGGAIVNTSTGASETASSNAMASYGSSKAALNVLTRYIAAQYGAQNVRCNAVLPGVVLTRGMQMMFGAEQVDAMSARSMLQRPCLPEDIAAAVHFLVSDDARQVTGELIRVNGGRA